MSNASDFIADATKPWAAAIVQSNNLIADAMGYTALPQAYKDAIWTQVDATDAAGHAPTVSAPAAQYTDPVGWNDQGSWNQFTNTPSLASSTGTENDFYTISVAGGVTSLDSLSSGTFAVGQKITFKDGEWRRGVDAENSRLDATEAEARTIFATQVAHALWTEYTLEFPWRITRYPLEWCQTLFDPDVLYASDATGQWNIGSSPYLRLSSVAGYDPYGTHQLINSIFSGYTHINHTRTVSELFARIDLGAATYPLKHHGTGTASGFVLSPAQVFDNANYADAVGTPAYVSRRGCHTTGPLISWLCRAMNLPASDFDDRYSGADHHMSLFPSIQLRLKDTSLGGGATSPMYLEGYTDIPGAIMMHCDYMYFAPYFTELEGTNRVYPRGYYADWIEGLSDSVKDTRGRRMELHLLNQFARTYLAERYRVLGWDAFKAIYVDPGLFAPGNEPWTTNIHNAMHARAGKGRPQ